MGNSAGGPQFGVGIGSDGKRRNQFQAKEHGPQSGGTGRLGDADWGSATHIQPGTTTPWGPANDVMYPAPGIARVNTDISSNPDHDSQPGVWLSPERNAAVPSSLRNPDGWYEGDFQGFIVAAYHPEAYAEDFGGVEIAQIHGEAGVKNWFPHQYVSAVEETTGTPGVIEVGDSHTYDREMWFAQHADDQIAIRSMADTSDPNYVLVTTSRGGQIGEGVPTTTHRVPASVFNDQTHRHPIGKFGGAFVLPTAGAERRDELQSA